MATETTFTVKPLLPTVLGDQAVLELKPTDLFIAVTVDTAHVVPGPIDVAQFTTALAHTLSAFPLFTGKVRRPSIAGGKWLIHLTNEAVPVTLVDSLDADIVPVNTIIQSPFTLAHSVDISNVHNGTSEEPLLKITITRFVKSGYTAIGLSYCHVAGDGYLCLTFLQHLSQAYLSVPPTGAIDYQPVSYPPRSLSVYHTLDTPLLVNPMFPIGVPPPQLDRTRAPPSVRVAVRLNLQQLEAMRQGILAEVAEEGSHPRVSLQDCLVALLAVSLTRADPTVPPIQRIVYLLNHRGIHPVPSNAAGNALTQVVSEPVDTVGGRLLDIAQTIRDSIALSRKPEYVANSVALGGQRWQDAAERHESPDPLTPLPGSILVNSTRPFDWTSAHFGYPGRTRFFHTMAIPPGFVKIFTPNPEILPDGTWKEYKGGAEVVLYVRKGVEDAFHAAIVEKANALGVTDGIEYITVA